MRCGILLVLLVWCLLLPSCCQAQLFAIDIFSSFGPVNGLVHLDLSVSPPTVTPIGPTGQTAGEFGGLASSPFPNTLYWIPGRGNNNLFRVDTVTGAATLIGSHGLTDLFGLAYDSSNDVLYASQGAFATGLFTLDQTTGAATTVNAAMTRAIGGLAYDSRRDRLLGTEDGEFNVFEVDRATGALTLLVGPSTNNNGGSAYDPSTDLLWNVDAVGDVRFHDLSNGFAETFAGNVGGGLDGGAFLLSLPATAAGDPHLRGPHGEKFDFFGAPNGIYTLVSAPEFVVNMKLVDHGPKARFIDEVGILFGNATLTFTPYSYNATERQAYFDSLLKPLGGRAKVEDFNVHLELCRGLRISIKQRWTNVNPDGSALTEHDVATHSSDELPRIYHLDVDVHAPGCHDDFDGALGQTYQCRYAKEEFVFDNTKEPEYAVANIHSPSGAFSAKVKCVKPPTRKSVLQGGSGHHAGTYSDADAGSI